jgi:hypothetical protein
VKHAFIENETTLPTRDVQKISRWVLRELDVDLPSLVVRVKNTKAPMHSGRFYYHARESWVTLRRKDGVTRLVAPKLPPRADHLIIARVPLNPRGAGNQVKRGGPPPIVPQTWQESLVCIVAHEGMHVRQFLFPRENKPKWSEVECEWAEYRLLKRWRERKA